ncbi:MAG: NAD-dependent epimerase/dehydratase family protein [Bacteroidetes bacterium]|nr:NAD-dependent epimerase/dehydratase family protein [Bacteroidota bacterium]
MRFFVSGGAGFIGSHLVELLVERGPVTVYDNLTSGKIEFLQHHLTNPEVRLIIADLLDRPALEREMAGHDLVFHLAANPDARQGTTDTDLDLRIGTIATYNVLDAIRCNGIKKIVFSSSGTVYGDTPPVPLTENRGPLLPISLYGASKLACEGLISAYCHLFGMQAWVFRFANIVGGRATHGVIFDFIAKLRKDPHELEVLGDGTQEKPYLHVEECVDGILYGLDHAGDEVNLYSLGVPTSTDVNTIARIVIEEMGLRDVAVRHTGGHRGWRGDVPQVRFDVDKMTRLGWRAGLTSDEAVRRAVRNQLGK